MLLQLWCSVVRYWVVAVSCLYREHITDENHAIIWLLIEIKVIVSGWSHDGIQSTLSRFNTAIDATPTHDSRPLVYITL